jgi:hypothetical protein
MHSPIATATEEFHPFSSLLRTKKHHEWHAYESGKEFLDPIPEAFT